MDNKKVLQRALIKGKRIAKRGFFLKKKYKEKGIQDTVTMQDLRIHHGLSNYLEDKTGIQVVSEEGNTTLQKQCWILDPIDGTNNYLKSIPYCGISLALKQGKSITTSGIIDIVTGDFYWAVKGAGAWLGKKQLHVSSTQKIERSLLVVESGHSPKHRLLKYPYLRKHCLAMRTFGSSAIDMCHIAAGHFEASLLPHAHLWDIAAGMLLVKEAGGKVTDLKGKTFNFKSNAIIASNKKIHHILLKHLKK